MDIEKKRQYQREWMSKWRENNPDKQIELSRKCIKNKKLKYGEKYYKILNQAVKNWRIKNPEKVKAQRIVFMEKRAGRIKNDICFCGKKKTEAHHKDYSKPLEIIWLCKKHHIFYDKNKRIAEKEIKKII